MLNSYERPNLITVRILTLVTSRIIVNSGRLSNFKPIFSDKVQVNSPLTLIENGKMINKDSEFAEIFPSFRNYNR